VIADYVCNGSAGAVWTARTHSDARGKMGAEHPAGQCELARRREWFERYFWRAPDVAKNFSEGGTAWRRASCTGGDGTDASPEELHYRQLWLREHQSAAPREIAGRREWLERQLTDEEKVHRREWLARDNANQKRLSVDVLVAALTTLNDGVAPTEEQLAVVQNFLLNKALDATPTSTTITEEEFVIVAAEANLCAPVSDEALQLEEEALRLAAEIASAELEEEEQKFLADELAAELGEPGMTLDDAEAELTAKREEDEYLDAAYAAERDEAAVNEDDVAPTAAAAQWFACDGPGDAAAEMDPDHEDLYIFDECDVLICEDEEEEDAELLAALQAQLDDDPSNGCEDNTATENADTGCGGHISDDVDDDTVEMADDELVEPREWKLPLPEVTNPQYLKSYFAVTKFVPAANFFSQSQRRTWVVDHFTRSFYNLDSDGKIKKEHAANKLLQLERNIMDPTRLRLMFFDSAHSYELQFSSVSERERFYETAQAIRPSIRVYAPDLTNQDVAVELQATRIDGVGVNSVTVVAADATGKPRRRELTGQCRINASKLLTEPLSVWVGTFNLSGRVPPRSTAELDAWMPRNKHDIYAVAVQEATYRREEGEFFELVQRHLGRDYLALATMALWDMNLIVLAKKRHLLKITCVEGSTKATVHKSTCGGKGGIGISLRYLETSMAFVTCHLAGRTERNALRSTNLQEVFDGLQLGIHETDFSNQFHHVFFFGDFNYRCEVDGTLAMSLIEARDYAALLNHDQLTQQRMQDGILHGFEEAPVTFAPTYRMKMGNAVGAYAHVEQGCAPSYTDRIFTRSMANTWIRCTAYRAIPTVTTSEHVPVHATYIVRCVRPSLACFDRAQVPPPVFRWYQLAVAESTMPLIKKPELVIVSPLTGRGAAVDAVSAATTTPVFGGSRPAPMSQSVTHVEEFIETSHFLFIVRDGSEKRCDKALRGTAVLPLFSKIIGFEGVVQVVNVELTCHGKLCGRLVGQMEWVRPQAA